MTTYDLAVAICGAKRPCPSCENREPGKSGLDARSFYPDAGAPLPCPNCQGTGEVYVLGEGARRECPGPTWVDFAGKLAHISHGHVFGGCEVCNGLGWLPTILLPPTACPNLNKFYETAEKVFTKHDEQCLACGGTGTIQHVDERQLRELLEEIGCKVLYDRTITYDGPWHVQSGTPYIERPWAPTLLEAAAQALGVTEVTT